MTADQYREELVRDSFINGLSLPLIRQRLLENTTLSLEQAYTQAISLDLAQKKADAYVQPTAHVATVAHFLAPDDKTYTYSEELEASALAAVYPKRNCYFSTIDSHVQLVNQCVIIVRLQDISVESAGLKRNQERRQGMLLQCTLLRYVLSVLQLHSQIVCHMRHYLQ